MAPPNEKSPDSIQRVEAAVEAALRELLETKHLYQSVEVNVEAALGPLAKKLNRSHHENVLVENALDAFKGRWYAQDPSGAATIEAGTFPTCLFTVPDIKAFCAKCDRIEPFNPIGCSDVPTLNVRSRSPKANPLQNFAISFLCQGCKSAPEVFLVRRVGSKWTLCGRSPIEHVDVPKFIPGAAAKYVRGAIVAHQSGQTLAGLFLLRTSIEQWIRSLGAKHDKADQAIEWYMETLPNDFKQRFSSLRKVYEDLSDAIHKADESAPLFGEASAAIYEHFDARRLYRLPNPAAPTA